MTDNEIIKAMKICNSLSLRCGDGCPYYDVPFKNGKRCSEMMIDDALDLINRQKAEIERLKEPVLLITNNKLSENELIENMRKGSVGVLPVSESSVRRIDEQGIKVEAIKEFWGKVKKYIKQEICFFTPDDEHELEMFGDNLVKEMTEGKENETR